MSDIHVTYDGDTYWLQCFSDDPSAEKGVIIDPIDIGDSWVTLAEKVAEHEAQHGCSPAAEDAPDSEPPKVIIVTDDAGRETRFTPAGVGVLTDGTLVLGDVRGSEPVRVDMRAAYAPGRWKSVREDGATVPDATVPDLLALVDKATRDHADVGLPGEVRRANVNRAAAGLDLLPVPGEDAGGERAAGEGGVLFPAGCDPDAADDAAGLPS